MSVGSQPESLPKIAEVISVGNESDLFVSFPPLDLIKIILDVEISFASGLFASFQSGANVIASYQSNSVFGTGSSATISRIHANAPISGKISGVGYILNHDSPSTVSRRGMYSNGIFLSGAGSMEIWNFVLMRLSSQKINEFHLIRGGTALFVAGSRIIVEGKNFA